MNTSMDTYGLKCNRCMWGRIQELLDFPISALGLDEVYDGPERYPDHVTVNGDHLEI